MSPDRQNPLPEEPEQIDRLSVWLIVAMVAVIARAPYIDLSPAHKLLDLVS